MSWESFLKGVLLTRHGGFLAAEVEYWRTEALRMKNTLSAIERAAQRGQYETSSDYPPEPPVGTEYFDDDVRTWFRGDLGWYCAKDDCQNCPTQWAEVSDRLPFDAVRKLPGGAR